MMMTLTIEEEGTKIKERSIVQRKKRKISRIRIEKESRSITIDLLNKCTIPLIRRKFQKKSRMKISKLKNKIN